MKLTTRDKYHLHARAEFFASHQNIVKYDDLDKAVDAIFKAQNLTELTLDLPKWDPKKNKNLSQKQKKELRRTRQRQVHELNYKWFRQMLCENHGLIEKMTLFWHGHFACNTKTNPYATIELNNILRTNALGNFRDLLYAVSKSAAMIAYLHLRQNKKGKPNEDFARELCELFTLGRDVDYIEKDVTEIARAFTGWTTDAYGKHIVNDRQHDNGEKLIFGELGNFSGEDVLEMILKNPNCAKLIAEKVYRFFVAEKLNEEHVAELSNALYSSNYDITVMMKSLFKAEWFFKAQGKIVKSPIEYLVGVGKAFDLKFPDEKSVRRIQQYLGQVLFEPPNVAGWAGGRRWIDASRFALRLRLGSLILNKGYIMDELSPELDAQISKKTKRKDLKFFEEVDWDVFWKKNKDASVFDLLIRNENSNLKSVYDNKDTKTILRLLSTPDFQLT